VRRATFRWAFCWIALYAPFTPAENYQHAGWHSEYRRVSSGSIVQDKNFYVLSLLQQDTEIRAELSAATPLAAISKRMENQADVAAAKATAQATARSMIFSDTDIALARSALLVRFPKSPALQALVTNHLRPSGTYQRLIGRSDAEMLGDAWSEAARGINHVIEQFTSGTHIRYEEIDSPSYDVHSPAYQKMIVDARNDATRRNRKVPNALFFEPVLNFALRLLTINHRDEPARHEPLATGENRAAMEAMRHTVWSAYPYASLLVHGIGPETPGIAISQGSQKNSAAAAALYRKKMAPFIIVSGGYVHPKQTIFSEAVEMKRELLLVYGIPESAILIEPQARHTTTNVRNAVRILFAGGVPPDRPSLSVASKEHIDSILSEQFMKRCENELGYQPARYGKRISDVAAEFLPSLDSMQIDPRDPLDP
jgi:DUF218 domain